MLAFVIILLFVLITGLCIGSFLNVVVLRALSNESIVFPASKCPKCQHKLYWWHNIPILSYVLLGGKCGFCKEKISIQYPIVEAFTGLAFVLAFLRFGFSLNTVFAWAFISMFVVLATTDFREKVVFNIHTYILIGLGLLYASVVTGLYVYQDYSLTNSFAVTKDFLLNNPLTMSILGGIAGFLVMEIFARLGYLIAGTRAFGEGDSYIAAGLGAIFGWKMLLSVLVWSVIIQIVMTLPLFIKKEWQNNNKLVAFTLPLFLVYVICYFVAQYRGVFDNLVIYYIALSILLVLAGLACFGALKNIKNAESRLYLPFGPALLIAGFIFLIL